MIEHMAEDTLTSNNEEVQRHSLALCALLSAQRDLKERCVFNALLSSTPDLRYLRMWGVSGSLRPRRWRI
jgi:hypothetical protein